MKVMLYKHRGTQVLAKGVSGLRFNILSSRAESGGTIHVEDKSYDLNEGDLMAYLVTDNYHWVETCHGDKPRTLFHVRFCRRPRFTLVAAIRVGSIHHDKL
jgi:hypothetical protein